jgi:hypothetical protein
MYKHIVLAGLVLSGCAGNTVGLQGAETINAALESSAVVPPVTPPPASVQQAVMDAVRDKPVVTRPSSIEPRFSMTVKCSWVW